MTTITDENRHTFIPIQTSLAVLERLTPEAQRRIDTLVKSYGADSAQLYLDGEKMIGFTLRDSRSNFILNGGIEPDGSCHT